MNSIIAIIKKEFSPIFSKLILPLILNLFCCIILFLLFFKGIATIIPELNNIDTKNIYLPNVISLITICIAFGISYFNTNKLFHTNILNQIRTTNLMEFQIYLGKFLSILFFTFIQMIFSFIILTILTGITINILYTIVFLLFLLFSVVFIIQISIILGIVLSNQRTFSLILFFIFFPLILLSGVIIPSDIYSDFLYYTIKYLPTTMIIEGGNAIFLNLNINIIYVIVISLLNIIFSVLSYILFKKELLS